MASSIVTTLFVYFLDEVIHSINSAVLIVFNMIPKWSAYILGANILLLLTNGVASTTPPHIIAIVADDLGFNDVSFKGSNQFLTPNIDALGYHGVILNNHYGPALCTPSRGAFLTGKHPIHTGLQHFVIPQDEPWGLPLTETTMPQIFRNAGYRTRLVGKWHLGLARKHFFPTNRGFETAFGYIGGYIDYYDHTLYMLDRNYSRGHDMRRDMNDDTSCRGKYATDMFTDEAVKVIRDHDSSEPMFLVVNHLAPHTGNEDDPMQAPPEEIRKFSYISDPQRRTYAAMVSKVDESIGRIVSTLAETRMLNNSIILFFSDNGAPTRGMHANAGSNYPLKGQKNSPWEGGVRSPGVVWSPLIKSQQRVTRQLFHLTDWLPTLARAAGIKLSPTLKLDGYDMWDSLTKGTRGSRTDVLHNIDEVFGYSSYQRGNWKLVNGTTDNGLYDHWMGDIDNEKDPRANRYTSVILNSAVARSITNLSPKYSIMPYNIRNMRSQSTVRCKPLRYREGRQKYRCDPLAAPCLFNIDVDPCEYYNLAWLHPSKVSSMWSDIEELQRTAVPIARRPSDPRCDPVRYNYTWTWWLDEIDNNSFGL